MSIASSTETADRGPGVPGPALHVVFGAGPVGRAIARELSDRGSRVRLVNRSGGLRPAENVEVLAGDAGDPAFVREASAGADVIYECLNPGWNDWPTVFPRLQANLLRERPRRRRGTSRSRTHGCTGGPTADR